MTNLGLALPPGSLAKWKQNIPAQFLLQALVWMRVKKLTAN